MNEQLAKTLLASNKAQNVIKGLELIRKEGSLTDLNAIIGLSQSQEPSVRQAANDVAADLILRNLIHYFSQINEGVRDSLGKLMQRLDPVVIERIGKALYSEKEEDRLRAVQVLGLLGKSNRLREIVAEMVKDKDTKVRATAVKLLGKLVLGKDMSLVLALLNDKDQRVRANTIESLEEIQNPAAAGLLLRFRKDPSNRIRGNALKALWNLGHRDIMEELLDMIKSPDHLMRASGAWVIGEIGKDNKEMIDLVASVAQDENKLVRENAIKAQLKIGGEIAENYLRFLCEEEEVEEARKKLKR